MREKNPYTSLVELIEEMHTHAQTLGMLIRRSGQSAGFINQLLIELRKLDLKAQEAKKLFPRLGPLSRLDPEVFAEASYDFDVKSRKKSRIVKVGNSQ